MISEFVVVEPAGGNERPHVNANATTVEVDEGQTAATSGTYADPDGDAVTLSGPSLGAATDGGGGSWSWSYTTTDGPSESQLLYVTASDPGGHQDQAVFSLEVNNLPPSVSIASPSDGAFVQLGDPTTLAAAFGDPGTGDTHTCSIAWGDGLTAPGVVAEGPDPAPAAARTATRPAGARRSRSP